MTNTKTSSRRSATTGKVVKQTAAQKKTAATKSKAAGVLRIAREKHTEWKVVRSARLATMQQRAEAKVEKAHVKLNKIMERRANFEAKAAERLDKMLAKHDPKAKLRRKLASYQKKMVALEAALNDES